MERIPNAVYTKEFREEAVKLVTKDGLTIPEVGRRLSIAASTLRYWVQVSSKGKLQEVGRQRRPLTEVEMELAKVKRELAITKMELDILKKQPRTLPRSRCLVRDHERNATQVFSPGYMSCITRITERIL